MNELFLGNGEALNRNLAEVNKACSEYVRTHSFDKAAEGLKGSQLQASQVLETLTSSQYSPEKLKLVPEMLSPEDLAHLLSSIFQRMSHSQAAGFFHTLMASEESIRNAELFFQRFREYLHPVPYNMPL